MGDEIELDAKDLIDKLLGDIPASLKAKLEVMDAGELLMLLYTMLLSVSIAVMEMYQRAITR